jgi:Cof subfamily protein (haloacid dehalogenase superfamily)
VSGRVPSHGPFKLLALDVDGTLVDDSLDITPANLDALKRAMAAGVKVVLATGRMFRSAMRYVDEIATPSPVICYQGAVIRQPDGTLVREWALSPDAARTAVNLSRELGLHVNLYRDDNFYVEKLGWGAERYASVAQVEPIVVDDLMTIAGGGSTKVVFVDEHPRLRELEDHVRAAFEPQSRITFSMPEFLEVVDADVSKAAALRHVCEIYGIRAEQVVAAGDAQNDRELFAYSGLAVAPRSAVAEVREAADFLVAPPGEDGIAELVDRFILATPPSGDQSGSASANL